MPLESMLIAKIVIPDLLLLRIAITLCNFRVSLPIIICIESLAWFSNRYMATKQSLSGITWTKKIPLHDGLSAQTL